jgi:hypothetical protein
MGSFCEILPSVVLLGSDSLLAGLAIGPILGSWRARAAYAVLFGVGDSAATLLGAMAPHGVPEPPAFLLYLGAAALVVQGARRDRAWLYALPALFCLDNLAAGNPAADAPGLGLGSAAMAGLGLALGGLGQRLTFRLVEAGA